MNWMTFGYFLCYQSLICNHITFKLDSCLSNFHSKLISISVLDIDSVFSRTCYFGQKCLETLFVQPYIYLKLDRFPFQLFLCANFV